MHPAQAWRPRQHARASSSSSSSGTGSSGLAARPRRRLPPLPTARSSDSSPLATLEETPQGAASPSPAQQLLAAAAAAAQQQQQQAGQQQQQQPDYGYMREYAALKQQLLDDTRKSGGAVGAYLLLTVNGTAALAAMLGAGASYAYVAWLCRDVDAVAPTDTVPLWEANKIDNPWLRRAAKLRAAYAAALTPRLLVPLGLGSLPGLYRLASGEQPPLLYTGCLLLGFLSYKLALIVKLVGDLTPKSFSAEAERPRVEQFEDELDQWGRPKKRLASPIDAMPEDAQAKAYEQLEQQLAKEERRARQGDE